MNDNIKKLQQQIEAEEEKVRRCKHEYGEPFSNPETVREPYGFKTEGHGSDVHTVAEGYHDVEKQRWTRICKKCGNQDHTNKQEPVISSYRPSFKN